jgi:hypothetical protein
MRNSRYYSRGTSAIAPLGKVNVNTGRSKYFNIYETWGAKDTTWELYKNDKGNFVIVATSGTSAIHNSNDSLRREFHADQSRRYLGCWLFITSSLQENLKQMAAEHNFTSVAGYCYK